MPPSTPPSAMFAAVGLPAAACCPVPGPAAETNLVVPSEAAFLALPLPVAAVARAGPFVVAVATMRQLV